MSTNETLPAINQKFQPLAACPITKGLMMALASKTQASDDLICMSILSVYSNLLQGLIDVERPEVGVGPVSLFTLAIADSGDRKSTVSRLLNQPIIDFQNREAKKLAESNADYESALEVFQCKIRHLKKQISENLKKGDSIEGLQRELSALKRNEPKRSQAIQLIFEDITSEAIAFELSQGWGNAALASDEGGSILGGRIIQDLPRLNKLWSAEPIAVNRRGSESFSVNDSRLTIAIMAQENVLDQFIYKRGAESIGIGFLARFLVCYPMSRQGSRFMSESISGGSSESNGDWYQYQQYLDRANKLLDQIKSSIESPGASRKVIQFSYDAKKYWRDIYNEIEAEIDIGGRFQYAKDHASKLAEQVARMAALLSCVEKGDGEDISVDILKDAVNIALFFSDVYLQCFKRLPNHIRGAMLLSDYFQSLKEDGGRYIRKNKIRQSGPSRLRDSKILNPALDVLISNMEIKTLTTTNGTVVIDLYPNLKMNSGEWDSFCFENKIKQIHRTISRQNFL